MKSAAWSTLLLLAPALAGCLGAPDADTDLQANQVAAAWPSGLEGPFDVLPVEVARVEMVDGVEIETAVWRPDVPDGVAVPVVLEAQPYADSCYVAPTPATCSGSLEAESTLNDYFGTPRMLVEAGYAYAVMSVRGTGDSGGCFNANGPDEASDIGEIIDHYAAQDWSNGHVAMFGISYMGTTPWLGALQGRDALKAIFAAGIVTNEYTFGFTPQGAMGPLTVGFNVPYFTSLTLVPPVPDDDPTAATEWVGHAPARACPGLVDIVAAYPVGAVTDTRDADFFGPRNSLSRLGDVTAGVLVTHGFHEGSPGHGFEEDAISQMLVNANLTMVLGQWGHTVPTGELLDGHPHSATWGELLMPFLDHHLKGAPAPDWLGTVSYERTDGTWGATDAWPPTDARDEVLYLTPDGLRPDASDVTLPVAGMAPTNLFECDAQQTDALPTGAGIVLRTEPVERAVTIAGNPMLYAMVETVASGGLIEVDVYDLGPDGTCPLTSDDDRITTGAADLRFHDAPYEGHDFPTGTPTPVRIDLLNLAHTLEPGHSLAVAISQEGDYSATRASGPITLHGGVDGTQIVVPVVDGTFGGGEPTVAYPTRPFTTPPESA